MADTLRKMLVDGLQVETTDAGAAAIEKLLGDKKALETRLDDAEKAHQAALAAKDAELAKKDAELDAIKAKVLSDADLDKRVQERADLIAVANVIAKDVKTEGLTDAAIRKAVVAAKLGDAAISGKADAYIDARFDILAEDAKKEAGADPFARVVSDGLRPNLNDATRETKAWSDGVSDLNAWRYQKEA